MSDSLRPRAPWRKSSHSANGADCVEAAPAWRKSSRSANGATCAEAAPVDTAVAIRDSKDPDGPRLAFTPRGWDSFLARVKRGDTDL